MSRVPPNQPSDFDSHPLPLPNPAAGMDRMKALTRKLLTVSKADVDKLRAKERAAKGKRKGK